MSFLRSIQLIRDLSNGWSCEDTRGRHMPGRVAGLLRLLDDSFSIQLLATVRTY